MDNKSYFDGPVLENFAYQLLIVLVTIFTFSLGTAFILCAYYKWIVEHTVIDGERYTFEGKGIDLLVKLIVWGILTLITLGIYSLWANVKLKQWIAKNTHKKIG
ncbi:DUF898 family protein [Caviibacter abscessus]|uniref:DUF898 family protein n=1 Tax=Caviibacter abscessus TaxID=1766719 RepID=UPI00082EB0BB|nr:DUF898 family protein [Caviibacter abscessus]